MLWNRVVLLKACQFASFPKSSKNWSSEKCEFCYLSKSNIHTFSQLEFTEHLGDEANGHTLCKVWKKLSLFHIDFQFQGLRSFFCALLGYLSGFLIPDNFNTLWKHVHSSNNQLILEKTTLISRLLSPACISEASHCALSTVSEIHVLHVL